MQLSGYHRTDNDYGKAKEGWYAIIEPKENHFDRIDYDVSFVHHGFWKTRVSLSDEMKQDDVTLWYEICNQLANRIG